MKRVNEPLLEPEKTIDSVRLTPSELHWYSLYRLFALGYSLHEINTGASVPEGLSDPQRAVLSGEYLYSLDRLQMNESMSHERRGPGRVIVTSPAIDLEPCNVKDIHVRSGCTLLPTLLERLKKQLRDAPDEVYIPLALARRGRRHWTLLILDRASSTATLLDSHEQPYGCGYPTYCIEEAVNGYFEPSLLSEIQRQEPLPLRSEETIIGSGRAKRFSVCYSGRQPCTDFNSCGFFVLDQLKQSLSLSEQGRSLADSSSRQCRFCSPLLSSICAIGAGVGVGFMVGTLGAGVAVGAAVMLMAVVIKACVSHRRSIHQVREIKKELYQEKQQYRFRQSGDEVITTRLPPGLNAEAVSVSAEQAGESLDCSDDDWDKMSYIL